jgi:hypothetical protein
MKNTSAWNKSKLEKHEKIELVYEHSYNNVSVCFDTDHITPELLNIVEENCSETPFVYDICGGINQKMRVSFEF